MKKTLKALSFIISIIVLFASYSNFVVNAVDKVNLIENNQISRELTAQELKTAKIEETEIPEMISTDVIAEKKHVHRLKEQETSLDTILFQNKDGTKTLYSYADPVKYIDENGKVQDKSNRLSTNIKEKSNNYAYFNEKNDVNTYYPKELNKDVGIAVEKNSTKIEMCPNRSTLQTKQFTKNNEIKNNVQTVLETEATDALVTKTTKRNDLNKEEDIIAYDEVFGKSTKLEYTTTFDGVKENIILDENSNKDKFTFTVNSNGLKLVSENGYINFYDIKTNERKAKILPVYIYDSAKDSLGNESPNSSLNGRYELSENDNGTYDITIIADTEFLNSQNTVYPVYVDPTLKIVTESTTVNKNIEDLNLLNGPSGAYESVYTHYIGYFNETRGYGKSVFKFDGLNNNPLFQTLPKSKIINVNLILHISQVGTPNNINAYTYEQGWSEGITKSISYNKNNLIYTNTLPSSNGYYGIDITELARRWKSNDYTSNGIALDLESLTKSYHAYGFDSTECSDQSKRPSISLTFDNSDWTSMPINSGIYRIKNSVTDSNDKDRYLTLSNTDCNDTTNVTEDVLRTNEQYLSQLWKITKSNSDYYIIEPLAGIYDGTTSKLSIPSTADRSSAYIKRANGTGEKWKIIEASPNEYTVSTCNSTFCTLSSDRYYNFDSNNVVISNSNFSYYQAWKFEAATDVHITDVPLIRREKTNWCWIASALSVAKKFSPSLNITQSDIYTEATGETTTANVTGSAKNAMDSIVTLSGNSTLAHYKWENSVSSNSTHQLTNSVCKTQINAGHPFIVNRYTSTSGHSTVVYGYYSKGSTDYFLIRDSRTSDYNPSEVMSYNNLQQSDGYTWQSTLYYQ